MPSGSVGGCSRGKLAVVEMCKGCQQLFFIGKGAHVLCNRCLGVTQEQRETCIVSRKGQWTSLS